MPSSVTATVVSLLTVTAACVPAQFPSAESGSATERFRAAHGDFIAGAVYTPPVLLYGTYLPDAELHNETGEFTLEQWTLDATIPIPTSRDSFLITGAIAGQRHFDFDGVPTLADDTLHRYGPRLGFGHFVDPDLVVQAYWQPTIYSDLDGTLDSEDWRLWYGRGLAVWRESPTRFFKLGFALTDAVDTGIVPLAGVTWQLSERWLLDVLLPRDARLILHASASLDLSVGLSIEANEYRVRGPEALGEPRHSVHVQEVYAFLGAEYMMTDNLSTFLRLGSSIAGNYDYGYGGGLPAYENTLAPTWYVTAGVGWRF